MYRTDDEQTTHNFRSLIISAAITASTSATITTTIPTITLLPRTATTANAEKIERRTRQYWRKSNLSNSQTLQPSSLSVSAPQLQLQQQQSSPKRSPKENSDCLYKKRKARALFGWKDKTTTLISSQLLITTIILEGFSFDSEDDDEYSGNNNNNGNTSMTRLMLFAGIIADSVLHTQLPH